MRLGGPKGGAKRLMRRRRCCALKRSGGQIDAAITSLKRSVAVDRVSKLKSANYTYKSNEQVGGRVERQPMVKGRAKSTDKPTEDSPAEATPKPPPLPLPEGWAAAQDAEGHPYYYNVATGEATYDHDLPSGGGASGAPAGLKRLSAQQTPPPSPTSQLPGERGADGPDSRRGSRVSGYI